ncbi:hypothetical protein [Sphingomonas montanisoli]|uniref:Diguanylate cyclase n=1 Tax=Sphingomonas montanisoli TaxID=2606412 RepID=A0A5D9CC27_9SPHN|nr:hypothetical protein [Sphingomonas montanisoli]TZG29294.1 hypothetical protein FYJ91_03970 [Sphingomonas montanisoli]
MTADIYVDLVKALYSSVIPLVIAGIAFALIGLDAVVETRDRLLGALWLCGIFAVTMRLMVVAMFRRRAEGTPLDPAEAGRAERRYAACFFLFALALGGFAARAILMGSADAKLSIVALVFGYGAGVASSVNCRPWIAIPGMMIGMLPMAVTGCIANAGAHFALGLFTVVFMGAAVEAHLRHYRQLAKSVAMSQAIARWEAKARPLISL